MPAPKHSKAWLSLLVLAAIAAVPARAETLILHGFTLIDGSGRAPVPNAALLIEDGVIRWVGSAANAKARRADRHVDLAGKYVMPGMIDTHVHLGLTSDGLSVDAKNQTRANVEAQLDAYARYGVTTVLSMGTDQDVVLAIRDEQRATGRPARARVHAAGLGVVFEGGYGGLAGVTRKSATPADAAAAVAREAGRKVDIVKFWLDSELGTMPPMPAAMTEAVITAGHANGLQVAAHIHYLADARRVVDQGVDALSHSVRDQPVDAGLITAMKRRGTWQQASTLAREQAVFAYGTPAPWLNDPFFTQAVPPATLVRLGDPAFQARIAGGASYKLLPGFLAQAQRNLKSLAGAGIPYAMGTDAGGPYRFPGHSEHEELRLMVEAGLTPMQAIVAATASGATFLKARQLGLLQRGKWADLVVLDADPAAAITNSRAISAVYIAGRQVPSIKR